MTYLLLFGVLAGIIALYVDRARRASERNIKNLMRHVQESQQRETQRLSMRTVRPYYREQSGGGA